MANKKKQHYVPQCILKNFTNKQNQFYIFQTLKNTIIPRLVHYKDHCYTDYLYGKDGKWEDWLGEQESQISPIFQSIINGTILTKEQKNLVKQYILVQYMRTEKTIDMNHNMIAQIYSQIIPNIAKNSGINISQQTAKLYAQQYINDLNRTEMAVQDLAFAEDNLSHFDDLRMIILTSESESFVCSDHPASVNNFFHHDGGLGIDCAGIIVLMPISPQFCIMLIDDGIYDYENEKTVINLADSDVKKLNNLQYVKAKSILFSSNLTALEDIKQHFDLIYIDNLFIKLCYKFGMTDPILINLRIIELKKECEAIVKTIIPKSLAYEKFDGLTNLTIKAEYLPFRNDVNANFFRFGNSNDIPAKYYFVGNGYPEIIKDYLIRRGR